MVSSAPVYHNTEAINPHMSVTMSCNPKLLFGPGAWQRIIRAYITLLRGALCANQLFMGVSVTVSNSRQQDKTVASQRSPL